VLARWSTLSLRVEAVVEVVAVAAAQAVSVPAQAFL
jgi:hypothetical protein